MRKEANGHLLPFPSIQKPPSRCRPVAVALHPLPLFGVQEYSPFFPREIERLLQLLHIAHHAEAALRIGVVEGIRHRRGLWPAGLA